MKTHTLLDLRGAIPAFIHVSDGKMGDVNVLDLLPIEAGAFYVMDRGYLDFARLYKMHQAGRVLGEHHVASERHAANPVLNLQVTDAQHIGLVGVRLEFLGHS